MLKRIPQSTLAEFYPRQTGAGRCEGSLEPRRRYRQQEETAHRLPQNRAAERDSSQLVPARLRRNEHTQAVLAAFAEVSGAQRQDGGRSEEHYRAEDGEEDLAPHSRISAAMPRPSRSSLSSP